MRIVPNIGAAAAFVLVVTMSAGVATESATAQIRLVDNTIAMDPPVDSDDGSLRGDEYLTPFDVQNPAVGRLEPGLLTAVQNAATEATAQGIAMTVTSGWRSPQFQQRLLDDAIATYGSVGAARQYVQTPEQSRHVVGAAVDIGGEGADQWLIANGSRFGLCQIYANEVWHFELATDAAGICPPLLPNAAG
jgi:D-alanyl-D-alanine carboxypeptidase